MWSVCVCMCVCVLAMYNKAQRISNREFKLWRFLQGTESRGATFLAETCVMSHQSLCVRAYVCVRAWIRGCVRVCVFYKKTEVNRFHGYLPEINRPDYDAAFILPFIHSEDSLCHWYNIAQPIQEHILCLHHLPGEKAFWSRRANHHAGCWLESSWYMCL